MSSTDPTRRFSDRVDDYVRFRPSYTARSLDVLIDGGALEESSVIADIGSGTGKLAELFLERGHRVFGVEPNREMREAGERVLGRFPEFRSVDGTAEATTLDPGSVDVVTAGQAFHWFDPARARAEFRRILRPRGAVVIVWHDRCVSASPFMSAYEQLLRTFGTDYARVNHQRHGDDLVRDFFAPSGFERRTLPYLQVFDRDDLRGRLLSSSYAPGPGHPRHGEMLRQLGAAFDAHHENGRVTFEYTTRIYFGRLGSAAAGRNHGRDRGPA